MSDQSRPVAGRPLAWATPRTTAVATAVGGIGLLLIAIGIVFDARQTAFSYLAAYVAILGVALGALILLMIEHLIAASWFTAVRRPAEATIATLPALALLFVPIALTLRWLYPWTDLSQLAPHAHELVAKKAAYLNVPFFLIRAVVYFAAWTATAELVRGWSLRQDAEPGERWSKRQRALAGPGLIIVSFTLTFAAFDWIMSLAPTWYSTIFGVQIFSGGIVGTLALLAVLVTWDREHTGELTSALNEDHFSAIGKLVLTFAIFWAYITFSQLLIIWIANLPEEVTWYAPRIRGAWLWWALAVAVGHFVVPLALLLSFHLKRRPRVLFWLGLWLLLMHYLEACWIVLPELHPSSAWPHWQDAAALAATAGIVIACASWRAQTVSALPLGDPELPQALRYSDL
jgi:hypothetical protein